MREEIRHYKDSDGKIKSRVIKHVSDFDAFIKFLEDNPKEAHAHRITFHKAFKEFAPKEFVDLGLDKELEKLELIDVDTL